MEPRHRGPETVTSPEAAPARFRIRLAVSCIVLLALAMAQSPGLLAADTKFDLAVDPGGFLERALHLWDAVGALGQLQNQAYGYLWPMGPFFWLGSFLDVPAWVVQRLWLALVMCVALVGSARLARAFGVRSDLACIVAGFAYALSPRMLTTLGPISIEAWPSALAPWVLLPLVIGSTRGSARRAAAWSAVAVAMVGGVNAAATFAVIPLGVVWVLTRTGGPRRRSLMLWWPVFTLLGTAWWLVPLALMGTYSPPFLDFIESASNTTFPTDLFDALRGTSNWVPYLGGGSRAGNDLLREFYLPLNSGVLLAFGLAGLMLRRNRERLFLSVSVLVGLAMVTMGHLGAAQGWAAADLHVLLDGVLAPLRNVHKFDPIIRLPLVLGLAWTVDALVGGLRHARPRDPGASRLMRGIERVNQYALLGMAVVAVVAAALPAVQARITPAGATAAIPGYWSETADWLADQEGTALLVPGSSFGTYVWGSPQDEPMQALARSPWAVRNAVPLAPAGNIRMLDAIEARLAQGEGSTGLAAYLRRAGITHVVVRNDLTNIATEPDRVLVHQALDSSPGLARVETFGPQVGGVGHIEAEDEDGSRILVNGGWQTSYPAVEIYGVGGAHSFPESSDTVPVVVGGPEDLLDLEDLGVLHEEPTVIGNDVEDDEALAPDPDAPLVLTDGQRAIERHFGRLHDGSSATRTPDDPRRLGNPTDDYLLDGAARWSTTARLDGVAGVSASSSLADATAGGIIQPGRLPFAAIDGDRATAWEANYDGARGSWWRVDFERTLPIRTITITAGPRQSEVLRVRTAHGLTDPIRIEAGTSEQVVVDDEGTGSLRIEDASARAGHRVSIAEVFVPSVSVRRTLVLPQTPPAWGVPDRIVLRRLDDARSGCAEVEGAVRCVPDREVAAEEPNGFRRTFEMPAGATYDASLLVTPRPGRALESLVQAGLAVSVSASSTGNPDVRASALAAVDGDIGTTWSAALSELNPVLDLSWLGPKVVTGLQLEVDPSSAARLPTELTITWPQGRRQVEVDEDGSVDFPAIRADRLSLRVDEAEPAVNLDFDSNPSPVPVGIGELEVEGVPYLPIALSRDEVELPCGTGPTVRVSGRRYETSVTASPAQLYAGETVRADLCGAEGEVQLASGENDVDVRFAAAFDPASLVLDDGEQWSSSTTAATTERHDAESMTITPGAPDRLLALKQNVNRGWEATQDGEDLAARTVDGWRQGWQLAGADPVDARFVPGTAYRVGLAAGGLALMVLLVVAGWWSRRWSTEAPPLEPLVAGPAVLAVLAVGSGGLLAGWVGAAVAATAFLVAAVLVRRAPDSGPWLVALCVLPAALAFAVRPWGSADGWAGALGWPGYLVVAACSVVLGWLASPRRERTLRSRWAGFSTRR